MTGFGRATCVVDGIGLHVEIRTFNHRHQDVQVRVPRFLTESELKIRAYTKQRFSRGKITVSVNVAGDSTPVRMEIDREVVQLYISAARELLASHGINSVLEAGTLLSLPGVARSVEISVPQTELHEVLHETIVEASDGVVEMRIKEGQILASEIRRLLASIARLVEQLEVRADSVSQAVREKLHKRVLQLQQDTGLLDQSRLHQEIVLAADRIDVREELVRLKSHIGQFGQILDKESSEPVGRRLDFLLQEMGREANTVGSKAGDAPLAHLVVELKTEIERIREQIQNVE